jgi:hypothetical protein
MKLFDFMSLDTLLEDLTIDAGVETVVFNELDRGIYNMSEFIAYIKRRFPVLKDLWIMQNYVCWDNDKKDVYDLYKELGLRSLVFGVSQNGVKGYNRFSTDDVCEGGLVLVGEELTHGYARIKDLFACSKVKAIEEWLIFCLFVTSDKIKVYKPSFYGWNTDVLQLLYIFGEKSCTHRLSDAIPQHIIDIVTRDPPLC